MASATGATPVRKDLVPLECVRTRLAAVWFGGCSVIGLILIAQSVLGKYGDRTQEAWSWLLPSILPTLSMIISVLGYTAMEAKASESVVRRSYFRIAVYLSSTYLLLILATIMVQPLTGTPALDLMTRSNLWLGPFQGLVASALGVLFASKQPS